MTTTLHHAAERALLHELSWNWQTLNDRHFGGRLVPPVIALDDTVALGSWSPTTRAIRLSRRLVAREPWGVVVEVLRHEMAHQFVDEALRARHEGPHGPTFRAICEELGIDASGRGMPVVSSGEASRVLRRIQRLLALAESPNVHEAQAAMNAAHRLMLKHNVAATGARRYAFRQVGPVRTRLPAHEKILGGILCQHFFVSGTYVPTFDRAIWARGSVLEIAGTDENLEIATWVFDFLTQTAERLWEENKRARGIAFDRERRRFLAGVMYGFHEKLDQQSDACRKEGLVWRGDADLQDWVDRRYPCRTRGRATSMVASATWQDGRAAGHEIVLNKPIREGPSGGRGLLEG